MTPWKWFFASLPVLLVLLSVLSLRKRRARKALILTLLHERGEQTGMQLRDAGVGGLVYVYLYELEEEGFVARRDDGLPHPERGGHPLFFYQLKGTSQGAVS